MSILLAVLGRGVQQIELNGAWVPTDDLEMCDENGMHLPLRVPVDDRNPHCLIGGAELNVCAGAVLCKTLKPRTVVCAYGGQMNYLSAIDAPCESAILTAHLRSELHLLEVEPPEIIVWPRERMPANGRTNTDQEIINAFELACERGDDTVTLVTVSVHYARTLLMARDHLRAERFAHLKLQCFMSEQVVLQEREDYQRRMNNMFGSRAYRRTITLEQRGINRWLSGTYY